MSHNLIRLIAANFSLLYLILLGIDLCSAVGKVVDFGTNLPVIIREHPNKNWLIKFYAPWCYHCQQLEPTFINVAERIYHKHDHLIVGRVDCTKYGSICENYNVQSYPTIMFLTHNTSTLYKGDRSVGSLVDFAERLDGLDVRQISDCNQLRGLINQYGLIIVSTETDTSSVFYKQYERLARSSKSNYWFFHLTKPCRDFVETNNLYLLKKHLNKPVRYSKKEKETEEEQGSAIGRWLAKESLPVYGSVNSMNLDRILSTGKTLVIALLDEYKPAKKFSHSSREFNRFFETFARKVSQDENKFIFGWSSDLELIQSIVLGQVDTPNIIIINPDLTYYYNVTNAENSDTQDESKYRIPDTLQEHNLQKLLVAAKESKLNYQGGNTYLLNILRSIFSNYKRFIGMYKANPLLASILVGLPTVIVVFVIYTTCCYDGPNMDERGDEDEDDDQEGEDQLLLTNHVKQD